MSEVPDQDDGIYIQRLATAMLTLRVNTPAGEWLSDGDHNIFASLYKDALDAAGGDAEDLVLSMMNLAWYALMYLEELAGAPPKRTATEWLQEIATTIEADDPA